jgi:carbon-monoxide dehydrogenase large subunit
MMEPGGGPPDVLDTIFPGMGDVNEAARVRLESDGTVTVFSGQSPNGQSHKTTFAQIAAEAVGVPLEHVRVVTGDTTAVPFTLYGTGGSRGASVAGGAIARAATTVRERACRLASVLLEAAPDDIEITDGMIGVRGAPQQAMPLAMVALTAYGAPYMFPSELRDPLDATEEFASGGAGWWTIAVHCCLVDVDRESGRVDVERYLVAEDCGRMINPAVVEGQIVGGVAQGIGAVLLERSAYDETGQFLAGTFLDYLLPTALDVPEIEIVHVEMPSDNPINIRGVGEGGMIAAPPALTNAIADAIAPFGGRVVEQHLPPFRVLELMNVIGQ